MSRVNNFTYNAYQKIYREIMAKEDIIDRKIGLRILAMDILDSTHMENTIKTVVLEHLFVLINQYEKQYKAMQNSPELLAEPLLMNSKLPHGNLA